MLVFKSIPVIGVDNVEDITPLFILCVEISSCLWLSILLKLIVLFLILETDILFVPVVFNPIEKGIVVISNTSGWSFISWITIGDKFNKKYSYNSSIIWSSRKWNTWQI